jgi:hypothetical protein
MEIRKWAEQNNWNPISFVIEDGQPNIAKVEKTLLDLMGDGDSYIADVIRGRKDLHVPLQTADFLVHTFCEEDPTSFNMLVESDNVVYILLSQNQLSDASKEIKSLHSRMRNMKRRARQQSKRDKGSES